MIAPSVPTRRLLRPALGLLFIHFAAFSATDAAPSSPRQFDRPPDIILIVLDTVRRDRVFSSDRNGPVTPTLARWSRGSLIYQNARSPTDFTTASHFSMLTGYPPGAFNSSLDTPNISVIEELNRAGYETIGLSANTLLDPSTMPVLRPFDVFDSSPFATPTEMPPDLLEQLAAYRVVSPPRLYAGLDALVGKLLCSAGEMNRRLARVLEKCDRPAPRRPVFLFINFLDAHHPYMPPVAGGLSPLRLASFGPVNSDLEGYPIKGRNPRGLPEVRPFQYANNYTPEQVRDLSELYDAALRYLDAQLALTFGILARNGLLRHAVVVVTSDHGELFGEDGYLAHSLSWPHGIFVPKLFEVPLILQAYGGRLRTLVPLAHPVSLTRLADSIRLWSGAGRLPANHEVFVPRGFDLEPIAEFLSGTAPAPAARRHPSPFTIPTSKGAEGPRLGPDAERKLNQELIEKLRALGYLH